MGDLFKDLANKAKDVVQSGELKEKAGDALETAKEKAAPVVEKVKDAAGDVVDKVKGAATAVMSGEKPALDVKNELFTELGEEVAQSKDAIQAQPAASISASIASAIILRIITSV